jgi:hypothetical protein
MRDVSVASSPKELVENTIAQVSRDGLAFIFNTYPDHAATNLLRSYVDSRTRS